MIYCVYKKIKIHGLTREQLKLHRYSQQCLILVYDIMYFKPLEVSFLWNEYSLVAGKVSLLAFSKRFPFRAHISVVLCIYLCVCALATAQLVVLKFINISSTLLARCSVRQHSLIFIYGSAQNPGHITLCTALFPPLKPARLATSCTALAARRSALAATASSSS